MKLLFFRLRLTIDRNWTIRISNVNFEYVTKTRRIFYWKKSNNIAELSFAIDVYHVVRKPFFKYVQLVDHKQDVHDRIDYFL